MANGLSLEEQRRLEEQSRGRANQPSPFVPETAVEKDILRGQALGQILVPAGSLAARPGAEIIGDVADIRERRRAALEGLTPEEQTALSSALTEGIQRGEQTALRQLQALQARQGLRGGTAAAQQADVLRAGQEARARTERDIFLENIGAKRQALGAFEETIGGEAGRAGREQAARLQAALGSAALGSAERGSLRQQAIAAQQAAQPVPSGKK